MEIISINDFPLFIIPNLCCLCRFPNDLHDLPSWLRKPSTNHSGLVCLKRFLK